MRRALVLSVAALLLAGCSSGLSFGYTQLSADCDFSPPPRQPLAVFAEVAMRNDSGVPQMYFVTFEVDLPRPDGGTLVLTPVAGDPSAVGVNGTAAPGASTIRVDMNVAPPDPIPDWCTEHYCGAHATLTVTVIVGTERSSASVPVELGCLI